MKRRAVVLTSVIFLILSLAMLVSVTMAWLAMNRETTSNGMQLAIETTPNLIITNDVSEFAKEIGLINNGSPFAVTQPENSSATYKPSTHVGSYATYEAGLMYVSNTGAVNPLTGYANSSATLAFLPVPSSATGNPFFIDYVVYVASNSQLMESAILKARIESATKNGVEVTSGSLMATSVDVYRGTQIGEESYCGTLNVATKDTGEVFLFNTAGNAGTIPLAGTEEGQYLTYTFRCYFDGDLESDSSGIAYINTATLDTSRVSLNVMIYVAN
ncbi:MAG: hypothetical protein IJR83_04795 [Clostridia bacterium]|nr:hypothetical protein [Clostridia bacterium]